MEFTKGIAVLLSKLIGQQAVQRSSGIIGRLAAGQWPRHNESYERFSDVIVTDNSGFKIPLSELRRMSDQEIELLTAEITENIFTVLSFVAMHPEAITSDKQDNFRELASVPIDQDPAENLKIKQVLEFLLNNSSTRDLADNIRGVMGKPCSVCGKDLAIMNLALVCSGCDLEVELPKSVCSELGPAICQSNNDDDVVRDRHKRIGKILNLRSKHKSLEDIGQVFNMSRERVRQINLKALLMVESMKRRNDVQANIMFHGEEPEHQALHDQNTMEPVTDLDRVLDQRVDVLESLSPRVINSLRLSRVKTLRQVVSLRESDLLKGKDFGPASLHEVRTALAEHGLKLRDCVFVYEAALGLDQPVEVLEITGVWAWRALRIAQVTTLRELIVKTRHDFFRLNGVGEQSVRDIEKALYRIGLSLKKDAASHGE